MAVTYYAILTAVGAAKLANAAALGTTLQITQMAVGDGGGNVPVPDANRTNLVNEVRRAPLNQLSIDPGNASQIIAEQVIPESVGGWWIREMGLLDNTGALIAIANCAPSYKPQLAEGSGRTQTIRMVLIVNNTGSVELKIDPSVVLATREYCDNAITAAINRQDAKASVRVATTANIALNGLLTVDGVVLAAGNRVLVKNQNTGSQNGIYVVAAGAWARSADADENAEVTANLTVAVESGTTQADTVWQLITDAPIVVGTTALVFQDITNGLARLASPAFTGNPTAPTPAPGDNDTSIATTEFVQQAIAPKAPLASPAFTGNPTAPTPVDGDNDTSIATTAFVQQAIAPKAPLASPVFTGNPTAPTPAGGDNDTSIATTAFVQGEIAAKAPLASPVFTGNPTAPTPAQFDNDTSLVTSAFVQRALGNIQGVKTINASQALSLADAGMLINVNTGGGDVTLTMPENAPPGVVFRITKLSSNANRVIITSAQNFIGQGSYNSGTPSGTIVLRNFDSVELTSFGPGSSWIAGGGVGTGFLAVNGYKRDASGMMIQWGVGNGSTSGPATITFPIAFPNYCAAVVPCPGNPSAYVATLAQSASLSLTDFQVNCWSIGSTPTRSTAGFSYIAIGY